MYCSQVQYWNQLIKMHFKFRLQTRTNAHDSLKQITTQNVDINCLTSIQHIVVVIRRNKYIVIRLYREYCHNLIRCESSNIIKSTMRIDYVHMQLGHGMCRPDGCRCSGAIYAPDYQPLQWCLYRISRSKWKYYAILQWRHNGRVASQISSLTIVYSTVNSDADQRKHQSSASLAFVWGNSTATGEFPAQRVSNAENVSILWRHHEGSLGMATLTISLVFRVGITGRFLCYMSNKCRLI